MNSDVVYVELYSPAQKDVELNVEQVIRKKMDMNGGLCILISCVRRLLGVWMSLSLMLWIYLAIFIDVSAGSSVFSIGGWVIMDMWM